MKVLFPEDTGQRYYAVHFASVLEILRHGGADVRVDEIPSDGELFFSCQVDGRWIGFDFSDAGLWRGPSAIPMFKFHHRRDERHANVFPFAPVSFYDWERYDRLRGEIVYDATQITIAMRQIPYGNAEQRRLQVLAALYHTYGDRFAFDQLDQEDFWRAAGATRISVCVPGQNNNMLDRGQFQYMAFGAATLSPHLPELLPYDETLDGCYLPCGDSYDDLLALIDGTDEATLRDIGGRAAALFARTSTPCRLVEWIDRCVRAARDT